MTTILSLRWRNTVYLILLLTSAILVAFWWQELISIWRDHALTFLVAVVIMSTAIVVQARNFCAFLDREIKLSILKLGAMWGATGLLNYLGPLQPGILGRILYLRSHGVDAVTSSLATARQNLTSIWVGIACLTLSLYLIGDSQWCWLELLLLAGFIAVPLLLALLAMSIDGIERPAWITKRKQFISRCLSKIRVSAIFGVLIQYAIGALLIYWVYSRFGADIDFERALGMASLVYLSSMVALMPGNVGVLELVYIAGGGEMGLSTQEAVALALLLRAAHITACMALTLLGRADTHLFAQPLK